MGGMEFGGKGATVGLEGVRLRLVEDMTGSWWRRRSKECANNNNDNSDNNNNHSLKIVTKMAMVQ